jgi:hypothetical protein
MTPEVLQLLTEIFEVCVIPLLGVLTAFLVKYIKAKSDQLVIQSQNDLLDKYIAIAADTITACVIATNQTYVNTLKAQGKFDPEAQKAAFSKTALAVEQILSEEAKAILTEAFGDLNVYLTTQIEACVNECK